VNVVLFGEEGTLLGVAAVHRIAKIISEAMCRMGCICSMHEVAIKTDLV
jgi:hypothetical protein